MSGKVSEQLDYHLVKQAERLPHASDLFDRILEHGTGLELQFNVRKDIGEPVADKNNTYTDGLDNWFSFRVPKNSHTTPSWTDFTLQWSLARYIDAIGSTGWHWDSKRSLWLGYDFDAIVGHAAGVGVSKEELDLVEQAVRDIPWIEVRRSTGGGGLHLYVHLEGITAENHTEHAAIGRAVLSIMSDMANFDFASKVDVCGSNMWIWANRVTGENRGLECLKPATEKFSDLPKNWRDHLPVVKRERSRVSVRGIPSDRENLFTQLASSYRRVKLDEDHKKIIDELEELGDYETNWVRDHYLLQTHTLAFKQIALKYKGVFETASRGSTDCNCFAFPAPGGAWKVYRFGAGTSEAPTWDQDAGGWTSCWFNRQPDLKVTSQAAGAAALKSGGFEYSSLQDALVVAKQIVESELTMEVPDWMLHRKAVMIESKTGNLTIHVPRQEGDVQPAGWNSVDKTKHWTHVTKTAEKPQEQGDDYDSLIRCLTTPQNQPAGWAAKTETGLWAYKTGGSIKTILQYMGHPKPEAEQLMGRAEYRPWKMVSLPFQPEYPGNRLWNLHAPQLAYTPAMEPGSHPHWDMVFDHIGESLDKHLADHSFAASGREYLQAWFAAIIREPEQRLPYLFLYGPQNSGKSILHEAFSMLVTGGVVGADKALTSSSDFNGELEKAILCVVEEKDISNIKGAYSKIKEVVTAIKLSIRRMRTDVYMVDNYTHWIQCANTAGALAMFDDDTRITVLYVDRLLREIPRHIMRQKLHEEAANFLRTLLDFRLPPHTSRLRIPMIITDDKRNATEMQQNFLDMFIQEKTETCEGVCEIGFKEFYEVFQAWLPSNERWSRQKVSKHMPVEFRIEAGFRNKRMIRGLQWRDKKKTAQDLQGK